MVTRRLISCPALDANPSTTLPYHKRRQRGIFDIITIDYVHGLLITYADNIFFIRTINGNMSYYRYMTTYKNLRSE